MAFKKDQFHKDILKIIREPRQVLDGRGLLDRMLSRVRQPGIKPLSFTSGKGEGPKLPRI